MNTDAYRRLFNPVPGGAPAISFLIGVVCEVGVGGKDLRVALEGSRGSGYLLSGSKACSYLNNSMALVERASFLRSTHNAEGALGKRLGSLPAAGASS